MSDVLSVAQLVSRVKYLLESNFRSFSLEGEVSNLSGSQTGHWYFTLSDDTSSVSAALFRGDAARNPLIQNLKDGDKVIVTGSLSVYQKRGTFQVIVKKIFPKGQGDLKLKFEQLKSKLAAEGLFDPEVKKEIPTLPQKVAVITAERGAALQDFINVYARRSFSRNLVVIPALVQGDGAPESLRKALFLAQKYNLQEKNPDEHIDLIVLTRGGGSIEDLWAFNDEGLAYDIYNCDIPVISAVGHQVDFSISDFVADLRCETPTAAAEVITQYQLELLQEMQHMRALLINASKHILAPYQKKIISNDPKLVFAGITREISAFKNRLARIDFINRSQEFIGYADRLMELEDMMSSMILSLKDKKVDYNSRLEKLGSVIAALGPQNVLERGYTYLNTKDGDIISGFSKFEKVNVGQELELVFHDGKGTVAKVSS